VKITAGPEQIDGGRAQILLTLTQDDGLEFAQPIELQHAARAWLVSAYPFAALYP
jgi:hypothetical protein